ncbi:MAG: hypothetical protein JETCAE01_26560 [Anaerolineaceae bacterium]|nr:MAG: hypothetical protein JETCAE01_26560 [Anaerolineaceae bacterium]
MWSFSKLRFTSYALILIALGLIAASTQEVTNALSELIAGFTACKGVISFCQFVFWVIVIVFIFLLGFFLDAASIKPKNSFKNDKKLQQKLIQNLKVYAPENANVDITFANIQHQPLAESLKSVFDLAGWETQPLGLPLESYIRDRYFKGIEVKGFSKHLVESVAESLTKAGFSGVYTTINELRVKPENPKYQWSLARIYITIGHKE